MTTSLSQLMHPSWPWTSSSLPVGCPSNRPRFIGTPETSANNVTLVWDEPHIMDPLVLDPRYAVYTLCDSDAAQTLQAEDLQSSSYTITGLPASKRCTAQVVLYSRHCAPSRTGPLVDTVTFTTAATCEWVYVGGSLLCRMDSKIIDLEAQQSLLMRGYRTF